MTFTSQIYVDNVIITGTLRGFAYRKSSPFCVYMKHDTYRLLSYVLTLGIKFFFAGNVLHGPWNDFGTGSAPRGSNIWTAVRLVYRKIVGGNWSLFTIYETILSLSQAFIKWEIRLQMKYVLSWLRGLRQCQIQASVSVLRLQSF